MSSQTNLPVPRGYQLLNWSVVKQLSAGGFSIVYLAQDENDKPVAIKEYLPNSLALRQDGDKVVATTPEKNGNVQIRPEVLFDEGKTLARIQHPNVVRVLNFFAPTKRFMVMEYERGRTLQREIQPYGSVRRTSFVTCFITCSTVLREVHLHKLLHLDIKPANIYIRRDSSPVLLDFGSARQTLTSEIKRFTPMYTPGFAAPSNTRGRETLARGPISTALAPVSLPAWPVCTTSGGCATGRRPTGIGKKLWVANIRTSCWKSSTGACR